MAFKSPPKSRFSRSKKLMGLASSIAAREISGRVAGAFGGSFSGSRAAARIAQAKALVETLGQMKGAAMKAGQLLSIEAAEFFPPEVVEILSKLQDSGKVMDFSLVQEILLRELGAERLARLKGLTPEPIASASIGQVHAARAEIDGTAEALAVKVQFPGVADSIDSDLSLLAGLARQLLKISSYQADLEPLFLELAELLKQETDYIAEATLLQEYAERARVLPAVRVPRIFSEFSTRSVLTMSFEPGIKLREWMARSPALEEREFYGRMILDLYFLEFFEWGLVQTDPNFANFIFRPAQKELVLLDFGATKRYPAEFRKSYSQLLGLIRDGMSGPGMDGTPTDGTVKKATSGQKPSDRAGALKIAHALGLIDPRESAESVELFFALMEKSLTPLHPDHQPFHFGNSDFTQEMREVGLKFVKSLKYSPPPRALIFLHRKLGGVFHLLRALDIRLDISGYWQKVDQSAGK